MKEKPKRMSAATNRPANLLTNYALSPSIKSSMKNADKGRRNTMRSNT